jgi:hypothetical protein
VSERTVDPSAVVSLTGLVSASYLARAVQVAARLGIGEILVGGPLGIAELARRSGTHPDSLQRLLRFLSSCEIVEELEHGVFGRTLLSDHLRFLDHPGSGEESWAAWGGLLDAVRTGRSAFETVHGSGFFEYLAHEPELDRNWNDWNTVTARAWLPPVVDALGLQGTETVVDVGGGQGNLLAELLERLPGCRGVLVDLPSVVAGATPLLEERGVLPRCEIAPGDAFQQVPRGGDAYVLCRVLFNWDRERRLTLLRRCRQAMEADARLLIVELTMPEHGEPGRRTRAATDLNLWIGWGGSIPTRAEWASLLSDGGFLLRRVSDPVSPVFAWQVLEAAPA